MSNPVIEEGTIRFAGYETWYRRVTPSKPTHRPVLLIHGGPGTSSSYMAILETLTRFGFPVVRYDQLGCGRSDRPDDPNLWHPETFYDELDAVRAHLELDMVHVLGHSWGGMIAMVHAAENPDNVAGLILSSAPASVPRIASDTRELVAALPLAAREAIERHEKAGTTQHPDYERAVHEFNRRHICRLDPYPTALSDPELLGHQVYATMCGPSEFTIVGRLKDWDFTPRLGEIVQPTLILSGRFDEYTPAHAEAMLTAIPDGRWVCFESSAHCPFLEETDRYIAEVVGFLDTAEKASPFR